MTEPKTFAQGETPAEPTCRWCSRTLAEHLDSRGPKEPRPRVPCLLLKSNFLPREPSDTSPAESIPRRLHAEGCAASEGAACNCGATLPTPSQAPVKHTAACDWSAAELIPGSEMTCMCSGKLELRRSAPDRDRNTMIPPPIPPALLGTDAAELRALGLENLLKGSPADLLVLAGACAHRGRFDLADLVVGLARAQQLIPGT